MKIPTLLGLALLITALAFGVIGYLQKTKEGLQEKPFYLPEGIQVLNLQDNQATIVWSTNNATLGQVIFGTGSSLNVTQADNRDQDSLKEHFVHFVTLNDLKPNTKYFFKIKSSSFTYPEQPLDFKTAKTINNSEDHPLNKPIKGTVLNTNLNPIDEALIFLKIEDAQDMATFTSTAGNFIIPLTDLRSKSLESYYQLSGQKIPATLLIKKGDLSSEVKITLPQDISTLPPLTIGQNLNLEEYLASSEARLKKQKNLESPEIIGKFDLNNDKKVNSLDLAKVIDLYNSKQNDKKADFNSDGVIDQKDIDTISSALDI